MDGNVAVVKREIVWFLVFVARQTVVWNPPTRDASQFTQPARFKAPKTQPRDAFTPTRPMPLPCQPCADPLSTLSTQTLHGPPACLPNRHQRNRRRRLGGSVAHGRRVTPLSACPTPVVSPHSAAPLPYGAPPSLVEPRPGGPGDDVQTAWLASTVPVWQADLFSTRGGWGLGCTALHP